MNELPWTEHRLEGLEPDNLLAILALLGLLRALETARPAWRPRVRWSLDEPPLRPVLVLREKTEPATVAEAVAGGAAALAEAHQFDRKLLQFTRDEAREFLQLSRENPGRAELWAALISDGAVDETKGLVRKTPLNFLDVAQVAFLKTLASVCDPACAPKRGIPRSIEDACFRAWARKDKTLSFRWDPVEDSRYAYRANAPTDEKQPVEHGANVLASLGLQSMVATPMSAPGGGRLNVRGVSTRDGVEFWWPIWRPAASLATIEALLDSADQGEEPRARFGVEAVMVASRFAPPGSKYRNITPARPGSNPL